MSDVVRLPHWALEVMAHPATGEPLRDHGDRLTDAAGEAVAAIEEGTVRLPLPEQDGGINFYRASGGARFFERASIPYAMSSLDTAIYHSYLADLADDDRDGLVVDVGGGDGRNALPWLTNGYRRIAVIDASNSALMRFRGRVAAEQPDRLDHLLLIEADIRHLPLRRKSAARVTAIESLAYLNEDYEAGLRECARILLPGGRLLIADRDYEGALLTRLLYGGGVPGMLDQAPTRDVWDGNAERQVRSRCFMVEELASLLRANGLRILTEGGISALSLILGFLRSLDRVTPADAERVEEVRAMLKNLGRQGRMRRSHVFITELAG